MAEVVTQRLLKSKLNHLTAQICNHLRALDAIMAKPMSPARDHDLAKVANALELENDIVMHCVLGMSWAKIALRKKGGK